jgi:hypothetical protein
MVILSEPLVGEVVTRLVAGVMAAAAAAKAGHDRVKGLHVKGLHSSILVSRQLAQQ